MNKYWTLPEDTPESVKEELAAHPSLLTDLLYQRGIHTAEEASRFLAKDPADIPDPFGLRDMERAVGILSSAISDGTPIAIFGDYDADGVTATALLTEVITEAGGQPIPYLPNRFKEGYGLNEPAISELWERGARVLVTVDCGIRGNSQVEFAKGLGFRVIVTDHHHPGAELPEADAVINPKRAGDDYPSKGLAGVGLGYKLAQGLSQLLGGPKPNSLLDLVAVGTVADLAPLQGENRLLVAAGLVELNQRKRPGLKQLAKVSGLKDEITATDIAFRIGPRINASGRMVEADQALSLLLSKDHNEVERLAGELDAINRQRQSETGRVVELADQQLLEDPAEAFLLFALGDEFHEGVVGLAASRLLEKYYRPILVANRHGGIVKGSARSIPQFHITEALEQASDLLLEFGGHAAAAGFQLREEDVPAFYKRMEKAARDQFGENLPAPEIKIDAVVEQGELDEEILDGLDALKPFGHGNPAPTFAGFNFQVADCRRVGSDGDHLKLLVSDGSGYFEAIGFRFGELAARLPQKVDLAFHFEWNEFRGRKTPQLNLVDIRPSG